MTTQRIEKQENSSLLCPITTSIESLSIRDTMEQILRVEQLNIHTGLNMQSNPLVEDISFVLHKGETLAIVGESGSGKSVTANAVAGLLPKSLHISGGCIHFLGEDVLTWPLKKRKQLRGKQIGYVFQDYQGSFTPFITIGSQLIETICTHKQLTRREAKELALNWLTRVALPAERVYASYPFQLSGGQLQRIALAAVIMLNPALLIADEPTTALDVLMGEKVLDLMMELQVQIGCAILLISHNLLQVLKRSDCIAVMQEGRLVEMGSAAQIRDHPTHPYTRTLLDACPRLT